MKKQRLPASEYVEGILNGNRYLLSRAITLTESSLEEDTYLAQTILEQLTPYTGDSVRVGITGVPGVGKSSFIEALGKHIVELGLPIAVLAIDPSSQKTRGSIMGDKTRMETLAQDTRAFIRPTAAGSSLGGVARKTRETMLLCEAAGYKVIFIETVGVGQSEIAVRGMVDFFLLLMLAGAGDELQGIKKGIMEMADALVITKVDGDNIKQAKLAEGSYKNALHLFRESPNGWHCPVKTCSALTGQGIAAVWEVIDAYVTHTKANGWFPANRESQNLSWMRDSVQEALLADFYRNTEVLRISRELEDGVARGLIPPYLAANRLIDAYKQHQGQSQSGEYQ
jgi:LAO/AO transport system kinase